MLDNYHEKYSELRKILENTLDIDIHLCCAAGSRAYGIYDKNSDYDFTVVRSNTPAEILTGRQTKPMHRIIGDIDVKIYPFNNFIELLLKSNPNLLEVFGLEPDDFFYISEDIKPIFENKQLFFSKECEPSFKGYALSCRKHAQMAYIKEDVSPDAAIYRQKSAKSMFECLRIYEQGTQLFTTGEIKTRVSDSEVGWTLARAKDGDILDDNLNPTIPYADTIFSAFAKCFDAAFANTKLPAEPDYDAIRQLQMNFNRQIVLNGWK